MSQTEIITPTEPCHVSSAESTLASSDVNNIMSRIAVNKLNICGCYTLKKGLATSDMCQLCKQQLTAPSLENMQKGNLQVQIAIGKCEHCFHKTCLTAYMSKGNVSCPIDNTPWSTDCDYTFKNVLEANMGTVSSAADDKPVSDKKSSSFNEKIKILNNLM